MRRPILAVALLAGLTFSCTRSFQVYDANHLTNRNRDYLFYALPRTVVTVDVPVTRTDVLFDPYKPPQCKDEVEFRRELGLPAPPAEASKSFKAGKPVIGTRTEPDPDAIYAIDLQLRKLALTSGAFELTESGILTTETISNEDKSIDAVLSIAKLGVAVATGAPISAQTAAAPAGAQTTRTAAPGCVQAKDDILKIRAARTKVLTDSIIREGATKEYTEFVLERLDALETALAEKFSGPSLTRIATIHCELRPTAFDQKTAAALFRLSNSDGAFDNMEICQVPKILRATDGTTAGISYVARVASDGPSQYAEALKKLVRPSSNEARGFFYRVPANGVVTVEADTDVRARQYASIAQLGTPTSLPVIGGALVRKASMSPTLSASGGLTKLTLNAEPSGQDAVDSLVGLAGSVHDARLAEKQAEAASKDELAVLKRKRELLEQQKAIKDLENALNGGQ